MSEQTPRETAEAMMARLMSGDASVLDELREMVEQIVRARDGWRLDYEREAQNSIYHRNRVRVLRAERGAMRALSVEVERLGKRLSELSASESE